MIEAYTRYHFFEWCMQQDPDKVICHSCWNTCALGDFARDKIPDWDNEEYEPEPEQLKDVEWNPEGYNCPIFEKLKERQNDIETYYHLQEEIVASYPAFAIFINE